MGNPVGVVSNKAEVAEKNVIGSVLLDERCIDLAIEIIKPQDFGARLPEMIFSTMCSLSNSNTPINVATILSVIGNDPLFVQSNGIGYLMNCQCEVPSASNIEHFCKIVRSESLHRKLISFSDEIKSLEWSVVDDADLTISKLSDDLLGMISSTSTNPWTDFKAALHDAYEDLLTKDEVASVATGFIDLDAKLTGLRPGALTIVAARPAMGKTAFGLNILSHVAFNLNMPVAFFSLEMTTTELVNRVLSSMSSVNGNAIRQKRMSDDEWDRLFSVAEKYSNAQIFIDETPGIDISLLRERARRLHRQFGIKMIIIDYLQLMHSDSKRAQNREQEVATISRGLKGIAKELKIPVIALAQLNRALDTRGDKHPIMSDLRESGSIEQDSDNILFIHREDYYRQGQDERDNTAEIIIAKQRSGPTGIVKLNWEGEYTRFSNIENTF